MNKFITKFIDENTKKIRSKKFANEASGYDMSDVDSFLDEINNNIEVIKNYLLKQENMVDNLKIEIGNLNQDIERVNKQCEIYNKLLTKNLTDSGNYLNILDRVSKLEGKYYKK